MVRVRYVYLEGIPPLKKDYQVTKIVGVTPYDDAVSLSFLKFAVSAVYSKIRGRST